MGMFINETAIMCVTPHIQGRPEDYGRVPVQVTVAMNGQDFNEVDSDAYVTFVGTGSDSNLLKILLFCLLLALLILAIAFFCFQRAAVPMNRPSAPYTEPADSSFNGRINDSKLRNMNPDRARLSPSI